MSEPGGHKHPGHLGEDIARERVEALIRECQVEAEKAIESGNPPFGCVITDAQGSIVARAYNTQISASDPTGHAELNAFRSLGQRLGSPYLDGCVVFTNASSCSMCTSAAIKAHITTLYYGALPEESMDPWLPMEEVVARAKRPVQVFGPVLGDECAYQIAEGRRRARANVLRRSSAAGTE